jgi:hypothetical protein
MFLIGVGVIAWGYILSRGFGYPIWITGAIGLLNIVLGLITPKSRKVDLPREPSGAVKLVVDKVMLRHGKWRFSNYELVFLDNRLVMKKLTSIGIILLASIVCLAFGGFVGGITGLSVEEFLDQRKRDRIRDRNEYVTVGRGDFEIPYGSMSQAQFSGIDLRIFVGGRLLVFGMGGEYPPLIARRVRELIPNECWVHPNMRYV